MFSVTLTRLPSSKPPNANLALFEKIVSLRLRAAGVCFEPSRFEGFGGF